MLSLAKGEGWVGQNQAYESTEIMVSGEDGAWQTSVVNPTSHFLARIESNGMKPFPA